MNKCAGIFVYTCLIRPVCHCNENVYKIIFCVVFIVKQETFKPWFSQWCISMRWVLGGSHGYVSPVEAWGPSIMVSVIVAMYNFRCEKGQRWFLKTCLSSENFCLYIYMNLSVRFGNDRKKFPLSRTLCGWNFFLEAGCVRTKM